MISKPIQIPIKDDIRGRTISYSHIPASFSISSNIPNHTMPIFVIHISQHHLVYLVLYLIIPTEV